MKIRTGESNQEQLASDKVYDRARALISKEIYRQPGLLCTPRNFAQISKLLGKNIFWY
jgi:hypothetical protein